MLLAFALTSATQACKSPQSYGEPNSLIVRADSALWAQIGPELIEALERPVHSTRRETEFKVTYVATTDTVWNTFRLWEHVVALGGDDDQVVRRIRRSAGDAAAPAILQASDIWAVDQTITLVYLPEARRADAARAKLDDLYGLLREGFDEWVLQMMYASGVNDSLRAVLSAFGFSLDLPNIYKHTREDSFFRFRHSLPDPGNRIRSLLVTWVPADVAEAGPPSAQELLDWRAGTGDSRYDPPQEIQQESERFDSLAVAGRAALELRGVWRDRSDFPAAGPFIARAIPCSNQGRLYFIDAWVYAPNEDKWPLIRQLEYLLGSFRCSDEEPLRLSRASRSQRPNAAR